MMKNTRPQPKENALNNWIDQQALCDEAQGESAEEAYYEENGIKPDMSQPKDEIVVVIEGGVLSSVHSNRDSRVIVVDHDNLKEKHSSTERENLELRALNCIPCECDLIDVDDWVQRGEPKP